MTTPSATPLQTRGPPESPCRTKAHQHGQGFAGHPSLCPTPHSCLQAPVSCSAAASTGPPHPGDVVPSCSAAPRLSQALGIVPSCPLPALQGSGRASVVGVRYLAGVHPAGVGAHHVLGDGAVVARAVVADVAADHRPLHLVQLVRPAAAVVNGAPSGHLAHRVGRHVPVLPLEGQHLHVRVQLRFLLQLPQSQQGSRSEGSCAQDPSGHSEPSPNTRTTLASATLRASPPE